MDDYTLRDFIFDLVLGFLTGGLWWIYRIIKVLSSK